MFDDKLDQRLTFRHISVSEPGNGIRSSQTHVEYVVWTVSG